MPVMGFRTFFPDSQMAANVSDTGGNSNGRLEDFVGNLPSFLPPQWRPLVKGLTLFLSYGSYLGVDPTAILTFLGAIWALNKVWKQLYGIVYGIIHEYAMSNVHVSSTDEMYLHMMKWLAGQPKMVNSRSLAAETTSKTAWEDEDDNETLTTCISADGSGVYLNFSNQEAKAPPRFIPALGTHGFWFDGRYFRLHRKQESLYDDGGSNSMPKFKDKEDLVISCFGRSPEPIKELLRYAKQEYYRDHYAKTIVKRPSPQSMRRFGGRYSWMQIACRPVRPLKTVVLDAKQKVQVLRDMNEYLHPATPRWYANRGIPLRRGKSVSLLHRNSVPSFQEGPGNLQTWRFAITTLDANAHAGYLFHGPPGTGKTSLSFALAGVFGLDIYVISLLEPSLTEEDLSALFNSLPRRCVVLLEDIDTAGLARAPDGTPIIDAVDNNTNERSKEEKTGTASKTESKSSSRKDEWKAVSDLARELKKQGDTNEKKGISLSGLLNAIDGVASHEGRVLIMTTNKPESLDEALIRPGRVDLQVGFTNATQDQARELFERMYEADTQERRQTVVAPSAQDLRGLGADVVVSLRPGDASTGPLPDRKILYGEKPAAGKKGHSPSGSTVSSSYDKCSDEDGDPVPEKTSNSPVASPDEKNEQQLDDQELPGATDEEKQSDGQVTHSAAFDYYDDDERGGLHDDELTRIAQEFAAKIPESQFSPAEIQGFLLKRKKTPRKAMGEVDVWVEAMVKQKASRTKVLEVQ